METMTACRYPDCDKPSRTRGWCVGHYAQWRRHGTVTRMRDLRSYEPVALVRLEGKPAPECHPGRVYRWAADDPRWYCAECRRLA